MLVYVRERDGEGGEEGASVAASGGLVYCEIKCGSIIVESPVALLLHPSD